MDEVRRSASPRRRWVIIGGFALAGILIAILTGASAWQSGIHRSDLDQAESHSVTASLLQEAGQEGEVAAGVLRQYVADGDAALIPEIQSHSTIAVESLTQAVAQGGVADLNRIVVGGAGLADGAGQVIALRLSGDIQGAAAALEGIAPTFEELTIALEDAIALEQLEVSSLQASAATADDVASWLRVAAIAIGAATGLVGAGLILRAVAKRRVPGTASS